MRLCPAAAGAHREAIEEACVEDLHLAVIVAGSKHGSVRAGRDAGDGRHAPGRQTAAMQHCQAIGG